jgi:hypothetical protein
MVKEAETNAAEDKRRRDLSRPETRLINDL